jgi:hypothetical protein
LVGRRLKKKRFTRPPGVPAGSGYSLFLRRMKRENSYRDFRKAYRARMAKGFGEERSMEITLRQFGYKSLQDEIAHYQEWAQVWQEIKERNVTRMVTGKLDAAIEAEEYEKAYRSLPDNAPVAVEMDWIRSHEAMSRFNLQRNKTEEVKITTDDILHAPNGPAPSKAAVIQLIHWANHPGEFFKQVLTEQKKKSDSAASGKSAESDPEVMDVERMLDEMRPNR